MTIFAFMRNNTEILFNNYYDNKMIRIYKGMYDKL
jgi:hypothetical protein